MKSVGSFKVICWLVVAAIFIVAIGGPDHLHLCLDGQGQGIALHGPDGEMHSQAESATSGHLDEDVDLPETGVAKSFVKDLLQPALLLTIVFLFLAPVAATYLPVRSLRFPPVRQTRALIPPLRGPPRLQFA